MEVWGKVEKFHAHTSELKAPGFPLAWSPLHFPKFVKSFPRICGIAESAKIA